MFYVINENGRAFYDPYDRIIVHDIESEAQFMADMLTKTLKQKCTVEFRRWADSYSAGYLFNNYVLYKQGLNLYNQYTHL